MPNRMPERMSAYMPESMSEQMPEYMPERMSDRRSEYVYIIYIYPIIQYILPDGM